MRLLLWVASCGLMVDAAVIAVGKANEWTAVSVAGFAMTVVAFLLSEGSGSPTADHGEQS